MLKLLFAVLFSISAQASQPLTGEQLAGSLQSAGFPLNSLIVRTPENDPNYVPGFPWQFAAKISWSDTRFTPDFPGPFCTVEVYDDPQAFIWASDGQKARAKQPPPFGGDWLEVRYDRLMMLRMNRIVSPDAAAQYRAWFETL